MTQTEAPPPPPAPALSRNARIAAAVGATVVVGFIALYMARLAIAREVLVGWLRDRGVEAEARFDALGLGGLSARLRVGPEANPALAADQVEIRYGVKPPWSDDPFGLEVASIRLVRPTLQARFTGGKLSLGPLDPVLAELSRRPPRPDARQPKVIVEDGTLNLLSDYGPIRLEADAQLNDGKLIRLDARSTTATLRQGETTVALAPTTLKFQTRGGRFDALLTGSASELARGGFAPRAAARFQLALQGPYPDFRRQKGDGLVSARLTLADAAWRAGGVEANQGRVEATYSGRISGWTSNLVLIGQGVAETSAERLVLGGATITAPRATLSAQNIVWTRKSGDRAAARLDLTLKAAQLVQGDLTLRDVTGDLDGSASIGGGQRPSLLLAGRLAARGAWPVLGAPASADDPDLAALKRALGGFRLTAPRAALEITGGDAMLKLPSPLAIQTDTGGSGRVAALGSAPLYSGGVARFQLALAGGGLPTAAVDVPRLAFTPSGATAALRIDAAADLGLVRQGTVKARGDLRIGDEGLSFVGAECAEVRIAKLELGANDVDALSTALCPAGAPLFETVEGGWRIRGRAQDLKATAPFLETRVEDGAGSVDLSVHGTQAAASFGVSRARLIDIASQTRFRPLIASGQAKLAADIWTGRFNLADPEGRALAQADLTHNAHTSVGGVEIDTGDLVFAEAGRQPARLSPLLTAVASPVTGSGRFTGSLAWKGETTTSHGRIQLHDLAFKSAAGPVSGLNGDIALSSLLPPTAAPGQVLTVARVEALVPITEAEVHLGLSEKALTVEGGTAVLEGGRLGLERLEIPLEKDAPWKGLLTFEGVQLKNLVENSPLGDRIDLTARVTGKVPFEKTKDGVRISGGEVHAIEPGRLSIKREALTGVAANTAVTTEGAAPTPETTPDTFSDFAYQALENLAFTKLAAEVDSKPDGRLGMMFYVQGEHQPPQRQELRIGYMEFLNKSYMKRSLPLPSGVKVDLALDTSLNLDQLLADFAEYQRLKGSGGVQP